MASGFLLDTNIVSYLLDGRDTVLIERVAAVDECRLFVSSITCYELWFGLTRRLMQAPSSKRLLEIQSRLEQWSKDLNIVSFDGKAAGVAARFNSTLVQRGRILQQPDMFIAAQAIANNLVLVSHDHRAFEGLQKEGLLWEDCVHGNLIAVLFRAGNIRVL